MIVLCDEPEDVAAFADFTAGAAAPAEAPAAAAPAPAPALLTYLYRLKFNCIWDAHHGIYIQLDLLWEQNIATLTCLHQLIPLSRY